MVPTLEVLREPIHSVAKVPDQMAVAQTFEDRVVRNNGVRRSLGRDRMEMDKVAAEILVATEMAEVQITVDQELDAHGILVQIDRDSRDREAQDRKTVVRIIAAQTTVDQTTEPTGVLAPVVKDLDLGVVAAQISLMVPELLIVDRVSPTPDGVAPINVVPTMAVKNTADQTIEVQTISLPADKDQTLEGIGVPIRLMAPEDLTAVPVNPTPDGVAPIDVARVIVGRMIVARKRVALAHVKGCRTGVALNSADRMGLVRVTVDRNSSDQKTAARNCAVLSQTIVDSDRICAVRTALARGIVALMIVGAIVPIRLSIA